MRILPQNCKFIMFFFNLISDTRLKYFGQLIENFKKKSKIHVLGIESDPDPQHWNI